MHLTTNSCLSDANNCSFDENDLSYINRHVLVGTMTNRQVWAPAPSFMQCCIIINQHFIAMLSSGLGIRIIICCWYQIYSGFNDGGDKDINGNWKDDDGTSHDGVGGGGNSGARYDFNDEQDNYDDDDEEEEEGSHDDGEGI